MALQQIHTLIRSLEGQPSWRSHRRFQRIVSAWPAIVGDVVAVKTRPTGLQKQVLQVAVCNGVWAQNLVFERQHILKKLNDMVPDAGIQDIRFSTMQWQRRSPTSSTASSESSSESTDDTDDPILRLWRSHPSQIDIRSSSFRSSRSSAPPTPPDSPRDAFQRWATQIQGRSHHLPLCPQCRCPTPHGEIDRWALCSLCAAKRWRDR